MDPEAQLKEWGACSIYKRFFEPGEKTGIYASRDGCSVCFRSECRQTVVCAPEGQGPAEIVVYIESNGADQFVAHIAAERVGRDTSHGPCWVCDARQCIPDKRGPYVTGEHY